MRMRLAMLLLRLAAALRPAARLPLRRAARGAATDYGADQITVLEGLEAVRKRPGICLLYTSPSPRDRTRSRMPSSA